MPKANASHRGSMQVWPRVRAKRSYARVRTWKIGKEAKPMGFAGYKAGMTHVIINDNGHNSLTKGMEVSIPVTVIECPPLKVASIRFYKNSPKGHVVDSEIFSEKVEKELSRKLSAPKKVKKKFEDIKIEDCTEIRMIVYTQPKLTGIGKKKPDVFEMAIGGSNQDKLAYAKNILGKEIRVSDFAKAGQQIDVHSITKGHGTQGPHRRFGVSFRQHKSEKAIRNPANVGPWGGPTSYRVAHAGKTGFYQRTEYNKWLMKIGEDPKEVIPAGGFMHYGNVKNQYVLVKGSVPAPAKRLVIFSEAKRTTKKIPKEAPEIMHISIDSKQ